MVLQPPVSAGLISIVAAVIRDDRGRVLLVRKQGAAVFQQPGGKPEPHDADDLATLARELQEELGCRVLPGSVRHLCHASAPAANEPGFTVVAEVYLVQVDGVPRAAGEIAELCWVDPAAPGALPIARLSREHVLPVCARLPHSD